MSEMTWHVLDIGSVWVKEFASALGSFVPTLGWSPVMSWTGLFQFWERDGELIDPPLRVRYYPLQRGYHRFPLSPLVRLGALQSARMRAADGPPAESPLICTTPFYAPVAEKWEGPVIYYQTDLTYGYGHVDPAAVLALDRRLCRVATAVCPNSRRVGDYMVQLAGCDRGKITVIPNATREANILDEEPHGPGPLPEDLSDLPRPIIGVIGNLAGNLNWSLLLAAVDRTPKLNWAFVGPTDMHIEEQSEQERRSELLQRSGRVRFLGPKPYKALQQYARTFDAAVLPYRRKEPTYSGSSTRFYEHLAACRPMIATRGFEELLRKEPLVTLVDTADELVAKLEDLTRLQFDDGLTHARWTASRHGTWHNRALGVMEALQTRWPGHLEIAAERMLQHLPEDIFEHHAPEVFQVIEPDPVDGIHEARRGR
jgi:glycosyltransferase involved in cell wall biosynthesis